MAARQQHDHDSEDDYDDAPPPDDGGDDGGGEGGRIRSLESLSEAIERLEQRVERALGLGGGGGRRAREPGGSGSSQRQTMADSADDRRREIREELSALRAQERADAERGELMTRLGKVEKSLERAPRQLRRIEEIMGWHR